MTEGQKTTSAKVITRSVCGVFVYVYFTSWVLHSIVGLSFKILESVNIVLHKENPETATPSYWFQKAPLFLSVFPKWIRSSRMVRVSECQYKSPGFDTSIRRLSRIWEAAAEVHKKNQKIPCLMYFLSQLVCYWRGSNDWQNWRPLLYAYDRYRTGLNMRQNPLHSFSMMSFQHRDR